MRYREGPERFLPASERLQSECVSFAGGTYSGT
jgi:hypothetical protein